MTKDHWVKMKESKKSIIKKESRPGPGTEKKMYIYLGPCS